MGIIVLLLNRDEKEFNTDLTEKAISDETEIHLIQQPNITGNRFCLLTKPKLQESSLFGNLILMN